MAKFMPWGDGDSGYQSTVYEGSFATGVVPSSGLLAGGNKVAINGNNLGSGDVTSVTLCGNPATILADNSPTQVVVSAGAAAIPVNGDVVVNSTSYGVTVGSNGYVYLPPTPNALAATNITLNSFYANWSSASGATNYLLDVSTASDFNFCVAGYTNLGVGNVTTFWISGLNAATTYYCRVRCQQNSVSSDNSSTISVQTLNGQMSVNNGPAVGGNSLTIGGVGLGSGSDITNVTICGVTAVIQSQTANSVTVLVGSGGNGTGDIRIYSANLGVATFVNSYTYNLPGHIVGPFLGWLSVSNLPAARSDLAAVSVNGKIYAIGGCIGTYLNYYHYYSTVYVYNPSQPTLGWSSVSNLPAARSDLAAVSVNGKIYAIGGCVGTYPNYYYYSTVYVYDPSQPTLGWLSVSNLPVTRCALAAVSVNGKIYAIGGYNGISQSTVYVYDPSQPTLGWLNVSNLPAARSGLAAASVDGKIYAIGGNNGGGNAQSTVYVYDPSQPTLGWLNVSNLPAARSGLAATSMDGKIYAIGGNNGGGNAQSIVYVYDPSQPMLGWLSASNMPAGRFGSAAANVNGNIYAIGGYDGSSDRSTVYEGSFAPDVAPSSGPLAGGSTITISGNNLGKGDVTSVTLCSVPAIILSDNSPTQILVRAGAAAIPAIGDVVVNSPSYGVTAKSNAYTYLPPIIASMPAFDGKHLQLSWPTNCLGWELQAQTNQAGAGLGPTGFRWPIQRTTRKCPSPLTRTIRACSTGCTAGNACTQ
jgi:N-acetylneuraminic acid mutarotase